VTDESLAWRLLVDLISFIFHEIKYNTQVLFPQVAVMAQSVAGMVSAKRDCASYINTPLLYLLCPSGDMHTIPIPLVSVFSSFHCLCFNMSLLVCLMCCLFVVVGLLQCYNMMLCYASHDGSLLAIASSYTHEEGEKVDAPDDNIFIRKVKDSDVRPKSKVATNSS
jgi:hypothetical protein